MFKLTKLTKPSLLCFNQRFANLSSTIGDRFKNKVAVVTASTNGIGLDIARSLGQEGASVVISSRKKENVDQAIEILSKEGLEVYGTVCHVYKEEDRSNLFNFAVEKKGGVDIFVSNAAVNPAVKPILDVSESAWDKIFDTNVKAAFLLTKLAVPLIEARGGGSIVFISSVAGYQSFPNIGAYSVSKTALIGLSRAIAVEIANKNIRVNCVCPGLIETNFSSIITQEESTRNYILKKLPIRRIGKPCEVAKMVEFLCSNDASYITGESFKVSGGFFTSF